MCDRIHYSTDYCIAGQGLFLSMRQSMDLCVAWLGSNQLGGRQAGRVALMYEGHDSSN